MGLAFLAGGPLLRSPHTSPSWRGSRGLEVPPRRLRPRGLPLSRFVADISPTMKYLYRILFSGMHAFRCHCISPRCYGADIRVSQIVADNEGTEGLSPSSSGCSVHLKSDVLGVKSLKFLEENYADDVLTKFAVLSEEEREALASTPAHPAGLYALYASFLAGNLVEQLWNFAWPAAVALIHPSLLPVATVSFFTKLTIFAGGPLVGHLMDSFPRIPAYNYLTLVQTAAQLISAAMIIYALNTVLHTSAPLVLLQPWFIVLVGAAAIERLAGLALGVMIERDWVVLLAGPERAIALAQANATLNRIDLFCEITGASLFGLLLTKYSPARCLKFAAGLMIGALPVLVLLGQLTNRFSNGILDCSKISPGFKEFPRTASLLSMENIDSGLHTIRRGWREYMQQPVLPASVAYVMLYFNIALAPGAMMTAFLTYQGISPAIIGGFSGFCAFMGVAATFTAATLVKKLGILKAGAAGLIFQASLLTMAVAVLWSGLISQRMPLFVFLSMIVLSRLGHMSYDVVGTQILQTGIPANKANLIGATEVSMASLAEFMMLGVAIVANDVSHFRFLSLLSVCSIVGAALMFCRWLSNPSEEQRKLFSHNSHHKSQ